MADKLEWLNHHYVLLNNALVDDVVAQKGYKVPFKLKELALEKKYSQDYLNSLWDQKLFKEGCEFLGYAMHKRAAAWWAYCCVLSLQEELKINPFKPRDIEDIGKPKPFEIPEWAKAPEFKRPPELDEVEKYSQIALSDIEKIKADALKVIEQTPQEIKDLYSDVKSVFDGAFKEKCGKTSDEFFDDALKSLLSELDKPELPFVDEQNSPIFIEKRKLDEKLEAIRQKTIKTIKASLPEKSEEEIAFQTSNAMQAAYNCIVAPTAKNAQMCLDCGNACPDTPEGLCALITFWAYGNMTPEGKTVVRTPEGLVGNGLSGFILMCALRQGGTREFDERVEHYSEIGRQVCYGKNLWADHVAIDPEESDFNGSTEASGADERKENSEEATAPRQNITTKSFGGFKRFKAQ